MVGLPFVWWFGIVWWEHTTIVLRTTPDWSLFEG
jgi:hypothetical protein